MVTNQKLIICQGLPGSGKSTWALEEANKDPKGTVRINRDDIRNMLGKYWVPQRENLVTKIEDACILQGLQEGYNVIVDATNFGGLGRFQNLINILVDYDDKGDCKRPEYFDIEVEIQDFTDIPVEVCIERDSKRQASVGEKVIHDMYNKNLRGKQ